MKYRDIEPTPSRRFRLPPSHPVLAEISIDPSDQHRFEQLAADSPDTEIVGHDTVPGRVIMFVGCVDEDARQKLNDGWA